MNHCLPLLFVLASIFLIASSSDQFFCRETFHREQICTDIYAPVCAAIIRCHFAPCPNVGGFSNACKACQNGLVISYTNGPCPGEEVIGQVQVVEVEIGEAGENGENDENGEGEGEGEWNEESWLGGRTVCNNPPGVEALCAQIYEPVCGYLNGEDTGKTYRNDCLACYQGNVDYHMPGVCPGDGDFEFVL